MKILVTLLFVAILALGVAALLPLLPLVLAFSAALGWLFIWLLPIVIIAGSDKTTGAEKLAWILAIVFLSWFAWIFYFLLAPVKPRRCYGDFYGRRRV